MGTPTRRKVASDRDRELPEETSIRRFRPVLTLNYQRELHSLARHVQGLGKPEAARVLADQIAKVSDYRSSLLASGLKRRDVDPTARYVATLQVLRDLLHQGWELRSDDEGLILDSPDRALSEIRDPDPERRKEVLRRSFSFAREKQLAEPATSRFIRYMEKKRVDLLFTDGAELAQRLETSRGPDGIRPELDLIEPGAKDPRTGLLLQDVWRYARHYWSIPYRSTPGRNMFYLIRDAALSHRPLMGIAALGNPVLVSSKRDDFFGWSVSAFSRYLTTRSAEDLARIAAHLCETVAESIEEIYTEDLLAPGPGWQADWRHTVERLRSVERRSSRERRHGLLEPDGGRDTEHVSIRAAHSAVGNGYADSVDWQSIARTTLYLQKRAGALADLVWAYGVFAEHGLPEAGGDLEEVLRDREGGKAVEIALRRIKQKAVASNAMELITCGALPPYREILGGKLVAMLMFSGEVAEHFERRYSGRVSLISSALAGRPISRPARLAAITTSSLYPVGSSQYNRINVKSDRGSVKYERIGKTESYGTVHLSPDTAGTLGELVRTSGVDRRTINNLFGEGASPKLRMLRSGLDALGLDSSTFLRHHSPRLLYAACTCSNTREIMLGLEQRPNRVLPAGRRGTEALVHHWRERWLAGRVRRPDVLEKVREQTFDELRLGRELDRLRVAAPKSTRAAQEPHVVNNAKMNAGQETTFVERLYRSSNSYADRLNPEELEAIHVDLGVDAHLLVQARENRQIVVTGNPGDGKTHLIERLRKHLESLDAVVITDANACSDREILDAWRSCQRRGKPFVLAINEWPLYVLQRIAKPEGFTAVTEALRQVSSSRFYTERQHPPPPRENVVVIDLSLRDLLAPDVVERVIERLTQPRFYEGLDPQDPMFVNRAALQNRQVRERLIALLRFIAPQIGHVTMRQLVGFVAFLLTGGRSVAERLSAGQDAMALAYSTLAFEGGEGPLFDAVRTVFDPANVTHPGWDRLIWEGKTDGQDWRSREAPVGPLALQVPEREGAYAAIKRHFFFEHRNGDDILRMVPDDDLRFRAMLRSDEEGAAQVRTLVLALNRFYEPDQSEEGRDALHLWQSHRYDVRAPSAFVTLYSLPYQQLRIERMRLAPWVEEWLPPGQQARWTIALVAFDGSGEDAALLEVDRDLYLTLVEAQRGLGRSSWSRTATRRITRFADQIHRAVEKTSTVEIVRVRNVETNLEGSFEIMRKPARYRI